MFGLKLLVSGSEMYAISAVFVVDSCFWLGLPNHVEMSYPWYLLVCGGKKERSRSGKKLTVSHFLRSVQMVSAFCNNTYLYL